MPHQEYAKRMELQSTEESMRLYFALKERGVPAKLEQFDGYKHIDISVPEAKVNIEVDGIHHNRDAKQALSDLKRTYYSFLRGYLTIRIPNSLVRNDKLLDETADYLVDMLNVNRSNNFSKRRN
ncbi:DUF559 domain-containing protein [Hymenobacter gummosus]|uniref:DUF559 domain-containing protein n=2 Tax=Hymenobacter gummosus TaxID=1776032 RepID=A0A431U3W4_9BACT|nr:DUF559 domain-containing protein [Hymenobacter gummosus]